MCLCRRKRNNIIVGRPYTDCAERRRLDRDREKEGGREKERERERENFCVVRQLVADSQ